MIATIRVNITLHVIFTIVFVDNSIKMFLSFNSQKAPEDAYVSYLFNIFYDANTTYGAIYILRHMLYIFYFCSNADINSNDFLTSSSVGLPTSNISESFMILMSQIV